VYVPAPWAVATAAATATAVAAGDLFSSFLLEPSDSDGRTKIVLPYKRECDCFYLLGGKKIIRKKYITARV